MCVKIVCPAECRDKEMKAEREQLKRINKFQETTANITDLTKSY